MQATSENINIEVWDNFTKGDAAAFSKIYYIYAQDMFAYGLCFTSDRELIKDCIHEIFVKIFNIREQLERESLKFYLIRSLRNELYNAFRDAKETYAIEESEIEFTPVYSVEDHYIKKEQEAHTQSDVQKILSILNTNQREAIYYRYIEELSINEIAEIMGINYQSVQNLIQRSIQKLRKEYKGSLPLLFTVAWTIFY